MPTDAACDTGSQQALDAYPTRQGYLVLRHPDDDPVHCTRWITGIPVEVRP